MFLIISQNVESKRMANRTGLFVAPGSTLGGRGAFQGVAQPCSSRVLGSLTQASQCFLQDVAGITLLTFHHQSMSRGLAYLKGAGGAATICSDGEESNTHSERGTAGHGAGAGSSGTQWGAVF